MSTDGAGALERELPLPLRTAETGQVRFEEPVTTDAQTLSRPQNIALKLGHLDPVDEVSGQVGRLRNLGYYPLPAGEPDPELFRAAVEEFQCEHNLAVDGICGPVTQAKLEEVYGC
jgi:peptidoglycan hydrolase-like protein with peptidoglycan-binding domain